jgi:hypothetical protein
MSLSTGATTPVIELRAAAGTITTRPLDAGSGAEISDVARRPLRWRLREEEDGE